MYEIKCASYELINAETGATVGSVYHDVWNTYTISIYHDPMSETTEKFNSYLSTMDALNVMKSYFVSKGIKTKMGFVDFSILEDGECLGLISYNPDYGWDVFSNYGDIGPVESYEKARKFVDDVYYAYRSR